MSPTDVLIAISIIASIFTLGFITNHGTVSL